MSRKALIVWGGWAGHQPKEVAELFERGLKEYGFEVEVSNTLDAFLDAQKLAQLDLIVPIWTMGTITNEQEKGLVDAVEGGVGLAGCHGGMCDAFRNNTRYQFMTGGQWVAHPGNDGVLYTIHLDDHTHFITRGLDDFKVKSEQYYLHVDPAVKVLASTRFPIADGPHVKNGPVRMPQVWVKWWGEGRVYYNALGHQANIVAQPEVFRLCMRGCLWAAKAEELAKD